ncbi:MAG: hypothetical protein EPO22_08970, partial [Dehalococcoidia bacterium]
MPVRAGRRRQRRDGGPRLHAAPHGHQDRPRSRGAGRRRALDRGRRRPPAPRPRQGRRRGPAEGRLVIDKTFATPDDALHDVFDGATIMFGGFVSAGTPSNLILALQRRGTKRITGIANNIGLGDLLDVLCEQRQLKKFIATFAIRASGARASRFEEQYRAGEVELELVPQGTFVERIRAGGAGIGGFLTRTGLG